MVIQVSMDRVQKFLYGCATKLHLTPAELFLRLRWFSSWHLVICGTLPNKVSFKVIYCCPYLILYLIFAGSKHQVLCHSWNNGHEFHHQGWVMWVLAHLTSIGSDNALAPVWHQAIIRTNAGMLSGPMWTNFNEIWIKIQYFTRKWIWKCLQYVSHFVSISLC